MKLLYDLLATYTAIDDYPEVTGYLKHKPPLRFWRKVLLKYFYPTVEILRLF